MLLLVKRNKTKFEYDTKKPTEGLFPIPALIFLLSGIIMFFGGGYVSNNFKEYGVNAFNIDFIGKHNGDSNPTIQTLGNGKNIYLMQCQQCHQSEGLGLPGVYPPLSESPWLNDDGERIVKLLLFGMNGPLQLMGKNYNGNMPSFGALRDIEINSVVNYIRDEWGNNDLSVDENLVKNIRDKYSNRSFPWTPEELLLENPI